MLFNSIHFLFFFVIVSLLYYKVGKPYRLLLLFLSSCYFYMVYNPVYILILFLLILIDFCSGIILQKITQQSYRLAILLISIVSNLGILFYFKYSALFISLQHFFSAPENLLFYKNNAEIALPVGLSFHTFQSLGYILQVYKKKYPAETNLLTYSNFVLFFPQLVAGPIEKPQKLLPQFNKPLVFNYERTVAGLYKIAWGLFKKVAIADRLNAVTSPVFENVYHYSGLSLIVAILFFGIQIYTDFSGYSDIARGTAQILGYDLSVNFRQPYLSKSLYEFWKRWHITLTNWFREYVYVPLGGNKAGIARHSLNILIVFTLSGLWHGANFTFIAWGLWHATFYLLENLYRRVFKKWNRILPGPIRILLVFMIVSCGWIFFRANDLAAAQYIFSNLFTGVQMQFSNLLANHGDTYQLFNISPLQLMLCLGLILFLFYIDSLLEKKNIIGMMRSLSTRKRWTIYYIFILLLCLLGVSNSQQFIYFQF